MKHFAKIILVALSTAAISANAQENKPAAPEEKPATAETKPQTTNQATEPTKPISTSSFYITGGLGDGSIHTPDENLFTEPSNGKDKREIGGFGGKVGVGYNINSDFAVEANYLLFPKSEYKTYNYTSSTSATLKYSLSAVDLVLKGKYKFLTTNITAFIFGGAAYVMETTDYKNGGSISLIPGMTALPAGSKDHRTVRAVIGLGGNYKIGKTNLAAGVEFTYIDGRGSVKANNNAIPPAKLLSANLTYTFK